MLFVLRPEVDVGIVITATVGDSPCAVILMVAQLCRTVEHTAHQGGITRPAFWSAAVGKCLRERNTKLGGEGAFFTPDALLRTATNSLHAENISGLGRETCQFISFGIDTVDIGPGCVA